MSLISQLLPPTKNTISNCAAPIHCRTHIGATCGHHDLSELRDFWCGLPGAKLNLAWSSEVGRELTIQLQPVEDEQMLSNIRTAISLAEQTPGVSRAFELTVKDSENLLSLGLANNLILAPSICRVWLLCSWVTQACSTLKH